MQALSQVGRRVLNSRRHALEELSLHQAVTLEITELPRQHALTDAWNQAPELGESLRPEHDQREHNGGLPATADETHRFFNAAHSWIHGSLHVLGNNSVPS